MEIKYTSKDKRRLKTAINAKRKLDKFKETKWPRKIFTSLSALIAFCRLNYVESSYFKPKLEMILSENGISKLSYGTYDFERFQYFIAHQNSILSPIPDEVISHLD